jgi:Ricin-type beta-trefoil lectin domain-like
VAGAAADASTPSGHTAVTQPATDPSTYYGELINWDRGAGGSERCAGLYGTSTADNTVFTEYSCGTTGFNDEWLLIANFSGSGGTWYQLKNAYSGKCAMPINSSKTVGADVVQYTCTPTASSSGACNSACSVQLWRFEDVGTGYGNYQRLYNRYSNQCLNLKEGSLLDGTHIAQTNCGSSHLSDIWLLYPA